MPVVTDAVVDTITVTGAAVPAVTLTEPGKLQVGAGVTVGLMLQVRFTAPLNEAPGVIAKLKLAAFPALTVWEVCEPVVGATTKSLGPTPVPDTGTVCGLPAALSVIERVPARLPAIVGVKVMWISQGVPGGREDGQLFV